MANTIGEPPGTDAAPLDGLVVVVVVPAGVVDDEQADARSATAMIVVAMMRERIFKVTP